MRSKLQYITIALLFFYSSSSLAIDFNKSVRQRQQAKEAKRWSLSEWLSQKQDRQLMDTWLMYNSPSPYEFFFGLDTSSFDQKSEVAGIETSQAFKNYRGYFGAFVSIVGLYGEYESSDEELKQWKALFMVRLLGSSDQSTNLTAYYGLMNRKFSTQDKIQHQVAGGKLDFYFIRAFALTGSYTYIAKATSALGLEIDGSRVEGGAHIEFGHLRFYGSWYEETLDFSGPLIPDRIQTRTGILFGLRVYF